MFHREWKITGNCRWPINDSVKQTMYLTRLCSSNVFLIFRSPFRYMVHNICNNRRRLLQARKDQMRMFGKRFCFIAYNNNNNKAEEMVEIRFGHSPSTWCFLCRWRISHLETNVCWRGGCCCFYYCYLFIYLFGF